MISNCWFGIMDRLRSMAVFLKAADLGSPTQTLRSFIDHVVARFGTPR